MSKQPSLGEQLEHTATAFMSQLPAESAAIVGESFEQLAASHVADSAKTVSDIAPNFTLPNATGTPVTLYSTLNSGPVVLNFYRGGWCPLCNIELHALQAILPDIRAMGASLIGISPETPEYSLTTIDRHSPEFEVLSDLGNLVAREYGLLYTVYEALRPLYLEWGFDLPARNGDDSWEIPVPATYVIDSNSVVQATHVDKDYTKRMEPEAILRALKAL